MSQGTIIGENVTGQLHTVTELGMHRSIFVHGLGEASIQALIEHGPITAKDATYDGVSEIPDLKWIDFPSLQHIPPDGNQTRLERLNDTTHLVYTRSVSPDNATTYHFMTASDIMRLGRVPAYISNWLVPFMRFDRPHPPLGMARTDAIRNIATLPLNTTIEFPSPVLHPIRVNLDTIKALEWYASNKVLDTLHHKHPYYQRSNYDDDGNYIGLPAVKAVPTDFQPTTR